MKSLQQAVVNRMGKGILVRFFGNNFCEVIYHQLCEFDIRNMISFQIKVFGRNIKETTPDRYFIKVTARTSFTRLKVIRRKK